MSCVSALKSQERYTFFFFYCVTAPTQNLPMVIGVQILFCIVETNYVSSCPWGKQKQHTGGDHY